ncbi:hypothetical protein GKZ28_00910 [Clostridium chromiireducens]|uniref:Uncharacterized protein n=1 Tax=Clostridium chromiireducens TaxID=225345 RepID=A0A964W0N9_9CLOT|nr:hypothetical protein [Clostridium chromiireducens]MVX62260.1 hypothetical protein [Clostridium chromiireducens]
MANNRFPKVGDKVKIIDCKRAEKYNGKEILVKKSAFVFDREIVAQLEGVKTYIPVRNLEIIKA